MFEAKMDGEGACIQAYQDRMNASVGVKPYPILFRKGQKITKSRPRMTCKECSMKVIPLLEHLYACIPIHVTWASCTLSGTTLVACLSLQRYSAPVTRHAYTSACTCVTAPE